jgi:DNA-binding response OmpR family regulator
MAEKILIVDDDEDILLIVQTILASAGYSAFTARNGREGVDMALELRPSLILLDVMMPELSGWEVCTTLKNSPETRQIPIVMLTVKSEIRDLITGMQVGADDYITKPFSARELVARIHSLLRRIERARAGHPEPVRAGDVIIDLARHRVRRADKEVHLTPTEFDLLYRLASRPGIVFTREQLLAEVWGYQDPTGGRSVDSHVRALRKKLGSDVVRTVHGIGYAFEEHA